MNPPAALQGAMSRDRKPFTYTPGGLDLSEIKSERMAKRLIRNAMNQGVPEVPMHPIQPLTSTPVALPNYNCLPVQVFPSFNLPANPKSLLRTRSNPDPKDSPVQRALPPTTVNNAKSERVDAYNGNTPTYSQINNNRPVSMYEYSTPNYTGAYTAPRTNYGTDGYTGPILPEISYDAEYFRVPSKIYDDKLTENINPETIQNELDKMQNFETENIVTVDIIDEIKSEPNNEEHVSINDNLETSIDLTQNNILESNGTDRTQIAIKSDENVDTNNEKKEVKVVKKQVQKENTVEDQNGDHNGDVNVEAELTVKLPTKKSAAKTETKVEVVKKVLPDGSTEEIKTTTTKTTVDGRTEIKTKTETTIIPKEEDDEEVVEEEEEENAEEEIAVQEDKDEDEESKNAGDVVSPKENNVDNIVKTEERSETTTTTTKKLVVIESPKEEKTEEIVEEEQYDEEVEQAEPVTFVIKKEEKVEEEELEPHENDEEENEKVEEDEKKLPEKQEKSEVKQTANEIDAEENTEDEEVEEEEEVEESPAEVKAPQPNDDEEEQEEEEEYEEAEEKVIEVKEEKDIEVKEVKEEKIIDVKIETSQDDKEKVIPETVAPSKPDINKVDEEETKVLEETKTEPKDDKNETLSEPEIKTPLKDPSVPLEKVEDVEIKPIGFGPEVITKSHTENTEIITSKIAPAGGLSTQTEYNKVENIVTVNRTTKILDHNYENLTQQGIPTVKTYFAPPSVDRILSSPLPSRPYQPVYPPEPTTERRHSLLLERLSVDRQIPVDTYKYSNQTHDQQTQWQENPRAEVVEVSNVKPSSITNSQWYQQTKNSNMIYNNVTSTPTPPSWNQPMAQAQPQYQQYPTSPQPQYHQPSPQPQYQSPPQPQPQYQTQPQYQPSYTEPIREKTPSNTYSTYTPKPTWVSNVESLPTLSQPNQYSYLNKDTTESYQKTSQQYSSSYVPPPWEQDTTYVPDTSKQDYYQPPPPATTFTPTPSQSWKPPASNKGTKPPPISYVPPAPNQSFVKSVSIVEPPKMAGRKTYYSEYERRYISVPESTYIPNEAKYQPQPDASPQYYYDNNEPSESVEPQWRKELREFTEKTSQTTEHGLLCVQPPWEADPKYVKTPSSTYTPTPTWSQTVRPRSWRERSFESEYVGSQEWPKTNTLGRGRPLSSFSKNLEATIPERPRGVSVDRYNPNNYQSPAEHPPVQSHTLTTPAPHASYHNPNVPAYHARASAEPRDHPTPYQQRVWSQARASPIQSRSFKYLQWITGTDD